MTRIIVDTGPLVVYFNRRDRWHRWVADQMVALNPPLVTGTLDSDFEHYRRNGRQVIPLLHPA